MNFYNSRLASILSVSHAGARISLGLGSRVRVVLALTAILCVPSIGTVCYALPTQQALGQAQISTPEVLLPMSGKGNALVDRVGATRSSGTPGSSMVTGDAGVVVSYSGGQVKTTSGAAVKSHGAGYENGGSAVAQSHKNNARITQQSYSNGGSGVAISSQNGITFGGVAIRSFYGNRAIGFTADETLAAATGERENGPVKRYGRGDGLEDVDGPSLPVGDGIVTLLLLLVGYIMVSLYRRIKA